MKKIVFLILIFGLNVFITFGQKKNIYVNEDLEVISKKEFRKEKSTLNYININFDADSVFVNVNVKRVTKGKISISLLDSIKLNLSSDGNYFIENDFIVINYYPGKDDCNSSGNKDYVKNLYENYRNEIKKNKYIKQFFVYKSIEGTESYGKLSWIKDQNSLIETTFFPLHYPCGSFVLIDSSGKYYAYKGEYYIDDIFKLLKDENTFINND